MNKIKKMEGKLLLFLIAAIGVLCAGFIIIGCGSGSQSSMKVSDPFRGAFAIDFTDCPTSGCSVSVTSASFDEPEYEIGDKPVTVEAWVKPTSSDTTSSIVQRYDPSNGVRLYLVSGKPSFSINRAKLPTGTDLYVVQALSTVPANIWSHVAGVIASESHNHSGACAAESEAPHLDIYIDGVFNNCASSASKYASEPGNNAFGGSVGGALDEIRLWNTDRTSLIATCKDTELGFHSGDCGRVGTGLIGYQRFNEGEGHTVADLAGLGSGGKEYPDGSGGYLEWETGWTAGAPLTPAD